MHSSSAILARTHFESGPKIVNSYLKDIYFTRCTLHQLLLEKLESARSSLQKIFDCQTLQSFTYNELAQLIRKSATAFSDQFLLPGDYVFFIGANCVEYLALYFGAMCIGAVPIAMPQTNVSLQDIRTKIIQHNIQHLVISSEVDALWIRKLLNSVPTISKIIIYNLQLPATNPFHQPKQKDYQTTSDKNSALLDTVLSHPKATTFNEFIQNSNISPMANDDLYLPKNHLTATCLAVNSSGSGEWPPKILLHGHHALTAAIEVLAHSSVLDYRSIDRMVVYGPFEHLESLLMFLSGLFFGCNLILLPTYDYDTLVETVVEHGVHLAWLSSATVLKLLKTYRFNVDRLSPLGSLKKVTVFGGRVSADACKQFFSLYPSVKSLRHCYLIAESAVPVSMMIRNSHDYDSVGFALPNSRVKVVADPANSAESLVEAHKHGFICIEREPELFAIGYLSQYSHHLFPLDFEPVEGAGDAVVSSVTATVIVAGKNQPNKTSSSTRRWYRTEDVGYYDDEGLLYVYGKWFNTLGPVTGVWARVQESEIETILLGHSAVEEICLILKRDHTWAAAVVAKDFSTTKLPRLSLELGTFLNAKLAASSFLSQTQASVSNIFIKHYLPKTSTGRVIRCLIRDEVQNLLNIKRKF